MQSNIFSILVVILVLTGTALAAEHAPTPTPPKGLFDLQGTPEEQRACAPDSTRFCSDAIPDNFRVLACLQEHRTRLRKACLKVLEDHGQ